ncbi:translation initiation factor IF-1 [Candidatus Roizmanbacteria bacterium RIFCSPHIGHO2_02_FULL_40_9]|uniref:Translation initiation factor IF-1 n=2 Tax=Candidatus Roizmaniibacteriota TaxID=1752723 RepID=A0A1F7IKX5_9BACT|nr:MAG: translation initiation factor IF-1 [Candidatus Roizmanbacteria bacterium RIFCSPHIGHO2_02_FULL_40_9]OGK44028.1 MAG: translation initiation factor IF-1 [Candidatus Roizmanbacteria bacterium RIFCSPLOWO2_01_FULL_38_11]
MKSDVVIVEGEVLENLPNTMFKVKLDKQYNERVIICYLSGKMRKFFIKILPGDRIKAEMTRYDPERGRIIYRL